MKIRTLLLLTSATYWLGAMPAHAGIESLIIGIHGFLLSSTAIPAAITGTLATVIGYGIAGAAVLGSALLGQQRGGAIKPSDAKSTFETGESSVIEGVGRVRVGGLKAFGNTDGSTRARLICRLQGPIDAIEQYYLGQREVTVEANGDVSSPPWARPNGSWANWQDKLGNGAETAWAGLMSLFPAIWTSAHRVRGIAQSQLLFYNPGLENKKYLSLYQNGAPETEWVCRASRVYDPRDPSQSASNPGSWRWSDNAPLICAHVLRRDPAFPAERFNWARIADTANKADVLVPTRSGTEKRSRLWGVWAWESERGETMQQFLDSAGLEIRLDEEGRVYFELIEDSVTPEIDFDPLDIYDYTWVSGPEAVERPNICRIKYYSPERSYELAEINLEGIAWARVDDEVARYGPKYLDIDLPFCPSASQAQRIGRRIFDLSRADRGTMITNMVGLAAWGLLYAEIEEPDLHDLMEVRMDTPRIDDDNGTVEIPFMVWPTLPPWNPQADEAPAPDVIPELGFETDMITPDPPYAAVQITYPDGGKEFRIGFNLPDQDYTVAEASYRPYTNGLPDVYQSMTEFPGEPEEVIGGEGEYSAVGAYVSADLTGRVVDARVRVFNGDDGSYFSTPLHTTVIADDTPPGAPILVSGGASGDSGSVSLNVVVTTNDLRAASIQLERRVGILPPTWVVVSRQNVRPKLELTFQDSISQSAGVVIWRVQTLSSNGSGGPYLQFSAEPSGN
ncbi:phage tail protein [Rhizobium sp. LC145]|uniref:phage tail protein n=1 Tax=Rhizobium sp. LC145 TaxID=1120688 RepID=UPI00062A2B6A|nr:phage tail protein [Rhizobium sp. LC145]KKX28221.1 hypothetical protein YH62_19215 [Rhizobium sp. LC145]TKT58361.1 hypothetical protein FDR95_12190 [Rhizobiaceae bacterium LC148]